MTPDDKLRHNLHEALQPGPNFPSPELLDRIMDDVYTSERSAALSGRPTSRSFSRRRPWLPALATPQGRWTSQSYMRRLSLPTLAALAALLVIADLFAARAQVNAGRVEFVANTNLGHVQFVSSKAQPAAEYRAMKEKVLAGFNGTADFNSQPTAAQDIERILYEQSTGKTTVDLIALTHGDMLALQNAGALEDLTPLLGSLQRDRRFPESLVENGRYDTSAQYSVPWLQATYLMVVNRQALQYLPEGADVEHLTYDQLIAWGQNMWVATGAKRIGLPADTNGPRGGLIHRFLQGYAYPSFTGTTLTGFRSPEAVQMWQTLRRLWSVTNDWSISYTSMDAPLETGEVWVAWDHQARLRGALADDLHFLAVPAPSGPHGLGYMSAQVGLAIPRGAPNRRGAEALIEWLTRPQQQAAGAASLGFLPAVGDVPLSGPEGAGSGVAHRYQSDRERIETLPPEGLGAGVDAFNAVYQDAFNRIVVHGEDIGTVLEADASRLQQLVDAAHARCWPPDPPGRGACQIE